MSCTCPCYATIAYYPHHVTSGGIAMCAMRSTFALAGTVLLGLALNATALANQEGGDKRDKDRANERTEEPTRQQFITISTEDGEIRIRSVIVFTDRQEILATLTDTGGGVRHDKGNRLDLSGVPLIGGLFGGGQDEGASEPIPIGSVHILGPTLAIDLRSPPPTTFVVDLPPVPTEEKTMAGRALDATIREILEFKPREDIPYAALVHHLQGSEFLLDELQVRQDTSTQTMPRPNFGRIGILGEPTPDGPVNEKLMEELKELEHLLDSPDGFASLDGSRLQMVIEPFDRFR